VAHICNCRGAKIGVRRGGGRNLSLTFREGERVQPLILIERMGDRAKPDPGHLDDLGRPRHAQLERLPVGERIWRPVKVGRERQTLCWRETDSNF
jgi:hypothetical protein